MIVTDETRPVALIARRPELADYFGGVPRYALLAIGGPGGPRALVVHGLGEAPERYAAGLASALGPAVVPVP